MTSDQLLIPPWYSFCMFSEEHRSYLSSNTYINKNYVVKPFWTPRKSFGDSTKDLYFSRLYNDWRNMFININKENCVLIFFEVFPKHVKMAGKFHRTLKLSVYLIHFKTFFS